MFGPFWNSLNARIVQRAVYPAKRVSVNRFYEHGNLDSHLLQVCAALQLIRPSDKLTVDDRDDAQVS